MSQAMEKSPGCSYLLRKQDEFELCTHTARIPRPESATNAIHAKSNGGTTRKSNNEQKGRPWIAGLSTQMSDFQL